MNNPQQIPPSVLTPGTGILLPIQSLPNNHGIGSLGKEAYETIKFLATNNYTYWQILPLEVPGYGESPYQTLSVHAKNPLLIDINYCVTLGWLEHNQLLPLAPQIDYQLVSETKLALLYKAFLFAIRLDSVREDLNDFEHTNPWVDNWSTFISLKEVNNNAPWWLWKSTVRDPQRKTFHVFLQWLFDIQWKRLKEFAAEHNVKFIGDIPFYTALDNDSVWSNKELFNVNSNGEPLFVAGVPPDYFSATGQYWGNPIFNWELMSKDNYAWWKDRLTAALNTYDVVRIDHFRAFADYWAIPFGSSTALSGEWVKGVGLSVFKQFPSWEKLPIIIEDLGARTQSLLDLLQETPYPNMGIMQFGYDAKEGSAFKPSDMKENSVYYTGTHDNNTFMGWYNAAPIEDKELLHQDLKVAQVTPEAYIPLFLSAKSILKIIPLQDVLGLDETHRINTPGTLGINWKWRLTTSLK